MLLQAIVGWFLSEIPGESGAIRSMLPATAAFQIPLNTSTSH